MATDIGSVGFGRQSYGTTGRTGNTNRVLEDVIGVQSSMLPSLYAAKESKRRTDEYYTLEDNKLTAQINAANRELELLTKRSDAEIASNEDIAARRLGLEQELSDAKLKQDKLLAEKSLDQAESQAQIGNVLGAAGTAVSAVTAYKTLFGAAKPAADALTGPVGELGAGMYPDVMGAGTEIATGVGAGEEVASGMGAALEGTELAASGAAAAGGLTSIGAGTAPIATEAALMSGYTGVGAGVEAGASAGLGAWAAPIFVATQMATMWFGSASDRKGRKAFYNSEAGQVAQQQRTAETRTIGQALLNLTPEERTSWALGDRTKISALPTSTMDALAESGLEQSEKDRLFQLWNNNALAGRASDSYQS